MPGYSLLAPVPMEHFEAALAVLKVKDFVLFGSESWEVLSKVELGAKTYIYVSHAPDQGHIKYEAVFLGLVHEPSQMKSLELEGYRPSTAVGEKWGFYWKVGGIKKLVNVLPISSVQLPSGKYLKTFPHGPIHVVS